MEKKSETFSKDIPSSVIDRFADLHPELILKTPLDLWKRFVNDNFLEQTLEKTLLYARRDKNCPNFEYAKKNFCDFLAQFLSLATIAHLQSKTISRIVLI